MREVQEIADQLEISNLLIEEMPNLDLYMDQVMQLFENKLGRSKRKEDDKVLTKTMINNYSKAKLLLPIKNKKYSKQHLILISLIYQLKGTLSLHDIKIILDSMNGEIDAEDADFSLEDVYHAYIQLTKLNVDVFRKDVHNRANEVKEKMEVLSEQQSHERELLLLVASLVNMSNLYRRLAEKLIDDLGT